MAEINNNNTTNNKKHILEKFQSLFSHFKSPISYISAVLAGIAIGISPHIYANFTSSPKLNGRILLMATGVTQPPLDEKISHTLFLYIANERQTPVPVIDYELLLSYKDNTTKTCEPFYKKFTTLELGFDNYNCEFPSTNQYLLNNLNTLITPTKPISGFILFDGGTIKKEIEKLSVLLIDGFGNKHKIETPEEEFRDFNLLPFLIKDMKINKK